MRRVLAVLAVFVGLLVAPSAPASAETPWQPGEATYDVVTTDDIPVTMAYAVPYHPHTKAAEQAVPARKVTRYDIEIRPAFQTVEKGHKLRLLIGSGDTPHLLPPPMKLRSLLGGVYALQHKAAAPSFIDLPVVN